MVFPRTAYTSLPSEAGVYVYLDKNDTVLYVGKAKDLKSRVSSYFLKSANLGAKTTMLVSQIDKIKITIVESELEALLLEAYYIKKYLPKYNIRLTDSKMYLRIKITMQDDFPKVLLSRREDDPKALYFGPYPNSGSLKLVLKTIRRVFPFQSVLNHPKRICLYNHLGLCPCPPLHADSPEFKAAYRKNIRGIIRILEGESRKVQKELEKERDAYSKNEEYEKAQIVQKKLYALGIITAPFRKPFEYATNPNLRVDIRQEELDGLQNILNEQGMGLKDLERIECYDMSNTQGTHAVGSMVVFVNGEKEGSQYRKFRIRREWDTRKKKEMPNDFAMMKEVLKRRLNHDEWNTPSLIIVDGGKGQVSAAMTALAECGMVIPLVGLAKREETIVVPRLEGVSGSTQVDGQPHVKSYQELLNVRFAGLANEKNKTIIVNEDNFTEISLPKNSPQLHLIQRLRNEAHRFAITYHRKLRSKAQINKE